MKDKIVSIAKELLPYIIIIIVVFGIKTYIATPVLVDGSSMSPTLSDKQFLILNRSTKKLNSEVYLEDPIGKDKDDNMVTLQ